MAYLSGRFKTVRLGERALDIEGRSLPEDYAPIFINRSEEQAYSDYMIAKTFGQNWRRS